MAIGRKGRLAVALVASVAAIGLLLFWPSTNPVMIHARVRVLGPRTVYGNLTCCSGDALPWDEVVRGVRSGEPRWLELAVAFKPALDTHPGEEMVTAVAAALTANPPAAVELLIPAYGADLVCAGQGSEDPVDAAGARGRLAALASVHQTSHELALCREVLARIVGAGGGA